MNYKRFGLQNYLRDPSISVEEAQILFRFRTRSEKYKNNMKSNFEDLSCYFCTVSQDSQEHSFQCEIVKANVKIEGDYEDIFSDKIPVEVARTLKRIVNFRKEKLEPLSGPRAFDNAAE